MEFFAKRSTIEPEMQRLQSILAKKPPIPAVENVLIRSTGKGHALQLIATNLETTLNCSAMADQIVTHGSLLLPARKLFELVRLLPQGMVHFESNGADHVKITAGRTKFKIPANDPEDFPAISEFTGATACSFPSKILQALLDGVEYSIAPEDDNRFSLRGVKFESDADDVKMVSADGHRLSLSQGHVNELQLDDLNVLIPEQALTHLSKLTSDSDEAIRIGVEGNNIHFQANGRTLSSRLLTGDFPNYQLIIDKSREGVTDVIFNGAELAAALRRVALAADAQSSAVLFEFGNEAVTLSAKTAKAGEATEELPIEYAGGPFKINLNAKYMLEYLGQVESTNVHLGVKDSQSTVCLRATKNKIGYASFIMPMEL